MGAIQEKKRSLEECLESLWKRFIETKKAWYELAKQYVETIDEYPEAKPQIAELFREGGENLSSRFWNALESVGRGHLYWELIPGISCGNAALIRQLPVSDQRTVCNGEKYEMLRRDGDVQKVDIRYLEKSQARQLIGDGHIRDLAEQKAYLAQNSPADGSEEVTDPYRITARGLEVGGYVFSKKKLREILLQM